MRRTHFEALKPVCPFTLQTEERDVPLVIQHVEREIGGDIIEGSLAAQGSGARMEYPIIDGIPILVPAVRAFLSDNFLHLTMRDDLSGYIEAMLADGAGPGSLFDSTRQLLSTYGWDGYADLDADEPPGDLPPGAARRVLAHGIALAGGGLGGPVLDMGCATGRTAFELARITDGLVLGMDMNFAMLKLARRVLCCGEVVYPRRRVGLIHDQRRFKADLKGAERLDFWIADAMAPPFARGTFATVTALNMLDCVTSPLTVLDRAQHVLMRGGKLILASPHDWSTRATPVEAWIGGHSGRADENQGASEPLLRDLLTPGNHAQSVPGLRLIGEDADVPWHIRLHDRSTVAYSAHMLVAEKIE